MSQSYYASKATTVAMKQQGVGAMLRVLCTLFGRRLHPDKETGGDAAQTAVPRTAAGLLSEKQRLAEALDTFKVHYHMQVRVGLPVQLEKYQISWILFSSTDCVILRYRWPRCESRTHCSTHKLRHCYDLHAFDAEHLIFASE